MKQTMKRICCLLLLVCMLASMTPVSAAEEKTVVDYVLVLDCSGTMLRNDPHHLAATACNMFVDMIPIQDARVSVITFGYGGGGFDFHTFKVDYDRNLIHQVAPLSGDMTKEQKLALQEKITAAALKKGENTPVGQALAAAVETLISGGSTKGNACVILLSDGGMTSPIAVGESKSLVDTASRKAKDYEWPIFCIELDYKNSNDSATRENRDRLNRICELSGAGKDGRVKVNNADEVWDALWSIINRFSDPVNPEVDEVVFDENGVAEKSFTVPELASESNLMIYGGNVESVELFNKAQNTSIKFTESQSDQKYKVTVTPQYFSVKIVCPEAGEWVAKITGKKNVSVSTYSHSVCEMALKIVASPDGSERLTKNDTVRIQSFFSYGGQNQNNLLFYGQYPASLVVTSQDGTVKEYVMNGEPSGYHCEFPVSDIPSGNFTAQVILKHDMFRDGQKVSDPVTFFSENLPLTLRADAAPIALKGYVNGEFEALDMSRIFDNPDGDPVTYELTCTSDPTVKFDAVPDKNNKDVLHIATGMVPGTYTLRIAARDPDMTEPLVYEGLTLTVENRGIEFLQELEQEKVWVDYYNNFLIHQDVGNTELDIDLNLYFFDPDGVELIYGPVTTDVPGLLDASIVGSRLVGQPLEKGDLVVKTTVSDGVETIDVEFEVKVVSGKAEYWRTHWIYWALAAAAILVLILILLYIKSQTYMKGSWMLTITKDFNSVSTEVGMPARSMPTVRRAKSKPFAMKELVSDYLAYLDDRNPLVTEVVPYLNTAEGQAIKFKGIFRGVGFVVMDIPTGGNVEIEYYNQIKSNAKKFRVSGGELRVTLKRANEMGFNESISLYFKNTGK